MTCEGAVGEVVNIGNDEEVNNPRPGPAHSVNARAAVRPIDLIPYDQATLRAMRTWRAEFPQLISCSADGFPSTTSLNVIIDRVLEHMAQEKKGGSAG